MPKTTPSRPSDAVACATLVSARMFALHGAATADAIRHLYDGNLRRSRAHLCALRRDGLVTGRRNSANGYTYWTPTMDAVPLIRYAVAVCKCGADIEPDLDDRWTDVCASCLADLVDDNARRAEVRAHDARERAQEEDAHAQMLRARAQALRSDGGVLLGEEA